MQQQLSTPVLVVLAAGLGSRFGGSKQITQLPMIGRTIMELSIEDAFAAGVCSVVLVINKLVRQTIEQVILPRLPSELQVQLVEQDIADVPPEFVSVLNKREKPWGTGHALLSAKAYINGPAIVITADDYYGQQAYTQMVKHFTQYPDEMAMVAYPLAHTLSSLGGVNRGVCTLEGGKLVSVKEYENILQTVDGIIGECDGKVEYLPSNMLASMTFWGVTPTLFSQLELGFLEFLRVYDNVVKKEYYLPNCIEQCIASKKLDLTVYSAQEHWYGVTFKEELAAVAGKINEQR
ncbi:hypothetical protein PSECIP111951_00354 [Pseudoalteromonas holothuriae]|uniref:MobA-like NTP transferase domain-containing protein n=1 Tax=Pseudoalteromonas holothuriae TaxID=2963714 RepID=A0A9W4VUW0_9GAMM|nr:MULTISPECIES: NTP transferase domain-containing protein [unclassified Pseudoalteromonas]CAH9049603.1 hypothetical protein PSECIP111854_00248 [Pseudoalteromonas sp. CIP111854]CAH9051255.1 hypothetical protein PSECIP111951_00354 [Pseudoalteromonas sp. CIP111951]